YIGIREVVLKRKMPVYHIDHHSGWSPEESDALRERMQSMKVPILDYDQLCAYVMTMHRRRSPLISNDEEWGLASEVLAETDPIARAIGPRVAAGITRQIITA